MTEYILQMQDINKFFGNVHVLKNMSLNVKKQEIHALCGENGAGKSTLMNILSGVYPHGTFSGKIRYKSKECKFNNIKDSEKEGIVIIHQELALIPTLSIAENIFLGNENQYKGKFDWKKTYDRAQELMNIVGLNRSPVDLVEELSVGEQQLVEIAKALSKDVKLLILDEPTSALNENDSENLLLLLVELKKRGLSSIMISHKLDEVIQISDSITVIRDGETISTLNNTQKNVSEANIIHHMVGRSLSNRYPKYDFDIGEKFFEVKNWYVQDPIIQDRMRLEDISLHINKGEIVGIAGLMGSGRTELALSLFGKNYGIYQSGDIYINSQKVEIESAKDAIEAGIAYVSEDRKDLGLILLQDINYNISISSLESFSKFGVIDKNTELANSKKFIDKINIKANSPFQNVGNLSGGNQQKVVLAKWLTTNPNILILDEPTRGIDVGAKYEIYKIIQNMADLGKCVLVISSELPELLGICNRIYTMADGRLTGEFSIEEANQELLMTHMTMERNK